MNIDEAKKITTEHDALEKLGKRISAFRDGPKGTGPEPELSIGDDLLGYLAPLVERRVKDLAALFETATPANPVPAATPTRPKVKIAVLAKQTQLGPNTQMGRPGWEEWAKERGLKWSSVQNVLRDLEAERAKERRERHLKDPLNAGTIDAAENFASKTDADIQKPGPAIQTSMRG